MLRYIVERISDGKFLDLELPIVVDVSGKRLAGAGRFSGVIVPVTLAYRHAGSDDLIEPYASFIHEEEDGVIRASWLVTYSGFEGTKWRIEADGFSRYFEDRPYEADYYGVQVDPIAVARHVVEHAQSKTNADIGVKLVGSSKKRVGTDSDLKATAAKKVMDQKKAAWDEFAKPRKVLEAKVKKLSKPFDTELAVMTRDRRVLSDSYAAAVAAKPQDPALIASRKAAVEAKDAALKSKRAAKSAAVKPSKDQIADLKILEEPLKESYEAAKSDYDEAKQKASEDDGAWKILAEDTPDCLDAIEDAIGEAGYEWYEWSGWDADKSVVLREIRCVPRVGRKRDDLAFVEGANIVETVVVEDDATQYANTVIALGAGEGKAALRVTVGKKDRRRRKVYVLDAKHVTKPAALEVLARAELARRSQRFSVRAIRVDVRHPNAVHGSFHVGDLVLVDCTVGVSGRMALWRRIEEVEWDGGSIADLMLGEAL